MFSRSVMIQQPNSNEKRQPANKKDETESKRMEQNTKIQNDILIEHSGFMMIFVFINLLYDIYLFVCMVLLLSALILWLWLWVLFYILPWYRFCVVTSTRKASSSQEIGKRKTNKAENDPGRKFDSTQTKTMHGIRRIKEKKCEKKKQQ